MTLDSDLIHWTLTPEGRTSDYWTSRPYLTDGLRETAATAQVLLLPYERWREVEGPLFAAGTSELFRFLKDHTTAGEIELCVDDAAYKELSLHGDLIYIGTILVKYVVAPMVAALLAEYVKRQLPLGLEKGEVNAHIIIEEGSGDSRKAVRVDYEGPATKFAVSMTAATEAAVKQLHSQPGAPELPPAQEPPAQ